MESYENRYLRLAERRKYSDSVENNYRIKLTKKSIHCS